MRRWITGLSVLLVATLGYAAARTTIQHGSTLPTNCTAGADIFGKTTGSVGVYDCPATNTWRFVAGSTSGPTGPTGAAGATGPTGATGAAASIIAAPCSGATVSPCYVDLTAAQIRTIGSSPTILVAGSTAKALQILALAVNVTDGTIPFLNSHSIDLVYTGQTDALTANQVYISDPGGRPNAFTFSSVSTSGFQYARTDVSGIGFSAFGGSDDLSGAILANAKGADGLGYLVNDTFTVDGGVSGFLAAGHITGVSPTTYALDTLGAGYLTGTGQATTATTVDTLPITVVNTGTQTFTVAGDHAARFPATNTFAVSGSTANDGTYTVASSAFAAGNTTVVTVEAIPDTTADGNILASGHGFTLDVSTLTPANGMARVFLMFNVLPLP